MENAWPVALFPFVFFAIFPLFWVFVVGLIAWTGGWRAMAQAYPGAAAPPWRGGEVLYWRSARLNGLTRYKGCLGVAISEDGVHLRPSLLFRPYHAAVFLPWGDVARLTPTGGLIGAGAVLEMGPEGAPDRPRIEFWGLELQQTLRRRAPTALTRDWPD